MYPGPNICNSIPIEQTFLHFQKFTMIIWYKNILGFVPSQVLTFALKNLTQRKTFVFVLHGFVKWAVIIV